MVPALVFEHGIGGSADLPISLPLALAGAGAALAISFIVLALAWRTPRFDARTQGHPAPAWLARAVDGGAVTGAARLVGVALTTYVGWAAVAGPDNLANPTFGVVYVLLWVGLVPASLLLGPAYRGLSPLRSLWWLWSRTGWAAPVRLPAWVGLWPAAGGLLSFVWLELVFPESNYLWAIRAWFALYAVIVLGGAVVFGSRWIAAADPFEAFSTLVGHLSVWGRRADGTLVVRSPMRNLDGVPPSPGLVAVVSVLVGSTMFDSFQDSLTWLRVSGELGVDATLLDSVTLLGFCSVVGGLFVAATVVVRPVDGTRRRAVPSLFAHSVVPIVVGYFVAHYLSFIVEVGQQTLIQLSDPMVDGSNLLGTADLQVSYWLTLHPTLLATTKVAAIVGGHVLGVVAAHDRAMRILAPRDQLTGQLPLLGVMVVYTVSGLYLLLSV